MKDLEKKEPLNSKIIHKIMERAMQINESCTPECRDFRVMFSPFRVDAIILRWTTIDLSDVDKPFQCFHYECFNADGSPQNCSVFYSDQKEANDFFFSLKTLYKQMYAADHKI